MYGTIISHVRIHIDEKLIMMKIIKYNITLPRIITGNTVSHVSLHDITSHVHVSSKTRQYGVLMSTYHQNARVPDCQSIPGQGATRYRHFCSKRVKLSDSTVQTRNLKSRPRSGALK